MTRQRGVALITAIVLVAIAAVLATAIGFASAMAARRASTVFGGDQALLAAEGAEAMAAFILKQTGNGSGSTSGSSSGSNSGSNSGGSSLNDVLAQTYGPFELTDGVTLEFAQLEDQQAKFNINNLAPGGKTDNDAVIVFQQLLQAVGLETKWAPMLADWIDADNIPNPQDGAEDSVYLTQTPPYRAANLPVSSISELLSLPGFGRARYDRLAPYIAALPPGTSINVCTASPLMLDALANRTEYSSDPAGLADQRKRNGCFPTAQVFLSTLTGETQTRAARSIGVTTSYFRLRTFIAIGTARFTLYSLLYTSGGQQIRPILRTFGTE
jgi:general secretion pathway protein K